MWIGKTKFENEHAEYLVDRMYEKLVKEFGVTVQGSVVTLRFYEKKDGPLIQISMVISDVDDGERDPEDYDHEDK